HIPVAINGDSLRGVEQGTGGGHSFTRRGPSASECGDDSSLGDLADAIVSGVGEVNVAGAVGRHAQGQIHLGEQGRSAVPGELIRSVTGKGINESAGHHPDPYVAPIRDVDFAGRIHGHAGWVAQAGAGWRTAVPRKPSNSVTGISR